MSEHRQQLDSLNRVLLDDETLDAPGAYAATRVAVPAGPEVMPRRALYAGTLAHSVAWTQQLHAELAS